ncbi:MAG TPA: alpha/beta hydrolase [Roseimicrobium sp.]|nr:alpha/beta hydrolase [Roseimicrobium sp.]
MPEELQMRVHGPATAPTLVFLPGLHGDWTLVTSFRMRLGNAVRFVEFTYPRTLEWSLDDYADAIADALHKAGIDHGWVLGESYGSQIVWPLATRGRFKVKGIILAGGFVRHPMNWAVRLAARVGKGVSLSWLARFLFWYARYARFRHRHAPETLSSIHEFVERRTELDRHAAIHRLHLIANNDPRPLASTVTVPVHHLSGLWDPVVPWMPVRPWLKHHCPGWKANRLIPSADHNVLGTAPAESALQVLKWMNAPG